MSRLDYGLSGRFKARKKGEGGKFVLSDEQRQEMKEAFDLFDSDKAGRMDYHQLKVAMRAMGVDVRKAEVLKIMKEYDRSTQSSAPRRCTHLRTAPPLLTPLSPPRPLLPVCVCVLCRAESGFISYSDFVDVMTVKLSERNPDDEIRKAFALFDDERSGSVGLRQLRRVARELGETLGDEELQAMIDEFDRNGDGHIDVDEFMHIMKQSSV